MRNRLTLLIILYVLALTAGAWFWEADRLRRALIDDERRKLDQWVQMQEQWLNSQLDEGGSASLYQFVSGARDALNAYSVFVLDSDGHELVRRDCAEVPMPLGLTPSRMAGLAQDPADRLEPLDAAKGEMYCFTRGLERKEEDAPRALEIDLPSSALEGPIQESLRRLTRDLALVALLAAGGLWLILGWNVLLPAHRIRRRLEAAVQGDGADLMLEFKPQGSAEMMGLARALNVFMARTRDLASTVREQAYRVGEQVGEVRQTMEYAQQASQAVSAGVEKLAASAVEDAQAAADIELMASLGQAGMREVLERARAMDNHRLAELAEEQIGRMARIREDMSRLGGARKEAASLGLAVAQHGTVQAAAVGEMRKAFTEMAEKTSTIIQKATSFRFG
jgi:methyl-accepting chemotaxis protein